jgi:hypothetical protein
MSNISNLLEISKQFNRVATTTIKMVDSIDPVLEEISALSSFKDRVKLAREHFEELGEGSARTIFKISDSLILKIAHNPKGLAQNQSEGLPTMQCDCANKVLFADKEFKWIVMRFTSEITEEEFEDLIGFDFRQFIKCAYWKFRNEEHTGKPRLFNEIVQHPLFRCLEKMILENQLQIGDLDKVSSWGNLDGKIVLRDFGLTKDVFKKYYEDDDSSSSTATSSK